ncbi:MAG: biopolymer transporter ExbD [Saprospiraceae bacterium]|nr:biopolymer transporter ExbD [Candidatus Vicinibacter affinis]
MPKVKIPRKSTTIDMTAMCDVAFLLLTFFILTTKFRAQEVVQIEIPPSTAQVPIPDKDILMFNIATDGRIFFGLDDQNTRLKLLDRLLLPHQIEFTPKQKMLSDSRIMGNGHQIATWVLDKEPNERANTTQPGLKIDTTGGAQIEDLILFSRQENNNLRIAIKADKATEYKSFDKLIEALQNRKVNKFNIVTSARAGKE